MAKQIKLKDILKEHTLSMVGVHVPKHVSQLSVLPPGISKSTAYIYIYTCVYIYIYIYTCLFISDVRVPTYSIQWLEHIM